MSRSLLPMFVVLVVALAAGACLPRLGQRSPGQGGGTVRTAELATLSVHNETGAELVIAYRSGAPESPEIIVGRVGPGDITEVAPIPAGEPIRLTATRADGAALRLATRTFEADESWLWVIPSDARFEPGATTR
ncbi:MAG TPA: hypothetical protein VNZ57_04285 [Longimicrobiales bacterium]|nr:hypothetical protein [Longimicrobiales bacterium]